MSHRILDKQLIEIQLQKARMKRATRIASSIKLRLRINEESELRDVLNQDQASNNLEAITYWILEEQNRAEVDELPYLKLLDTFQSLLTELESDDF